jgi:CRP-like cAMP-binding protein
MLNPFRRTYTLEELNMFRFLSNCRLFEELTNSELRLFLPHLYLRNYAQNEVVFFRSDPSQALYIIKSGVVELNIDVHDKTERLSTIQATEAFGNTALLPNSKRLYNAVVVSDTSEIYVLPQINILEIFEKEPKIKAKVLESMCVWYSKYLHNLYKFYRRNYGFFEMNQVPFQSI